MPGLRLLTFLPSRILLSASGFFVGGFLGGLVYPEVDIIPIIIFIILWGFCDRYFSVIFRQLNFTEDTSPKIFRSNMKSCTSIQHTSRDKYNQIRRREFLYESLSEEVGTGRRENAL